MLVGGENFVVLGVVIREIFESESQSHGGESVAPAPRGFVQRRMAIEAVGAQVQLLHVTEVAEGHVGILLVAREFSSRGENRSPQEYRIAHFVVQGHGFLGRSIRVESEVGRGANQFV